MSARQQKAIAELVAVNEALLAKLAREVEISEVLTAKLEESVRKNSELNEKHEEQVRLKEFHKRRYDEAFKLYSETNERATRYEDDRDRAREKLAGLRSKLAGAERERDVARAHADAMRRQAFPDAPSFPWERGSSGEVRIDGPNLKQMLENDGYALIEFLREQFRNGVFGAQGGSFR